MGTKNIYKSKEINNEDPIEYIFLDIRGVKTMDIKLLDLYMELCKIKGIKPNFQDLRDFGVFVNSLSK